MPLSHGLVWERAKPDMTIRPVGIPLPAVPIRPYPQSASRPPHTVANKAQHITPRALVEHFEQRNALFVAKWSVWAPVTFGGTGRCARTRRDPGSRRRRAPRRCLLGS